jgi:hypothetical protein
MRLGLTPTAPPSPPPLYSTMLNPSAQRALQAAWASGWAAPLECGLSRKLMWAGLDFNSGPSFLQGNRPTTLTVFYFLFLLVCSLNLNLNLVLIPTNSCNPVDYLCNIVMINFMFRLRQVFNFIGIYFVAMLR